MKIPHSLNYLFVELLLVVWRLVLLQYSTEDAEVAVEHVREGVQEAARADYFRFAAVTPDARDCATIAT